MRRLLALVLALIIPTLIIGGVALATYKPGLPEMAQTVLGYYVSHLRQAGYPATVVAAQPAGYPRSLTAALSGPTFGDGIYFQVSSLYGYPLTPAPTVASLPAGRVITYSEGITSVMHPDYGPGGTQRPMPYPPEEIWCVQLQPEAAPARTVLLALHHDLYNDSWAVHELPPESAGQTLALVGCAAK